ncbi:two-component sensor kinase yycG [Acetivibrio straminisolvens JCM 21531]|uniref:histidine kinase n=1 Tax=Acetivibrio straminisolvens JCM 21531 TaxID=1294263 RepID=W4V7I6_9FIRM|nr:two-component sensor kinase yycG [Acetivibrio straminisolvens JCM 21531]
MLSDTADSINSMLNDYLTAYYNNYNDPMFAFWDEIYRSMLDNALARDSQSTGSIIWIVSPEGEIGIIKGNQAVVKEIIRKLTDDTGKVRLQNPAQYKDVMSGNVPLVREMGDFYGLFKDTNVSWLTIEKPFLYNEKVLGAIYLHTPVPEVQRARSSVFKFFMSAVAVSIIISIILVYIFSLKLSRPLKKINSAAKKIASGKFDERLDISSEDEIGELARSFNNMAGELQNLENMRRGFIANVSHELRTPMTSIHGFIEGILDGTIPPEKEKEYLLIVRDEIRRLNRLTTDLLDLARMESGEISINPVNFNINELIRRCIIKLENFITQKDIDVEANFEEEDMYVRADVDSIERVLINLMHNAVKFVCRNGKIKVSTSRYKNKILVSVEDNGIGIDKNEIDLVWERFYKSDKSRSKEKGGAGLGLAIVRNIINDHRQEIWVESEVGEGTKFYFTLDKGSSENA